MIFLKNKINSVYAFGFIQSEMFVLSDSKIDSINTIIADNPKLGSYQIKINNNTLFYQKFNSHIVEVTSSKINKYEDDYAYLSSGFFIDNHLFITNRRTKTYFEIGNEEIKDLGFYIKNKFVLDSKYYIDLSNKSTIIIFGNLIDGGFELWHSNLIPYVSKEIKNNRNRIVPNKVKGKILGYKNTIAVSFEGKEIIGLDIENGNLKWKLQLPERAADRFIQRKDKIYTLSKTTLWEIDIENGNITRTLDFSEIYERQYNDCPGYIHINNKKIFIEFLYKYDKLLIVDLNDFSLDTSIIIETNAFLRVGENDTIWHENQLYQRDIQTNTLYVFGEE